MVRLGRFFPRRRVVPASLIAGVGDDAVTLRASRAELAARSQLSEDQIEKLQVIAAKCPVHRILEGEVAFAERVELT